jgi:hypothetical protein
MKMQICLGHDEEGREVLGPEMGFWASFFTANVLAAMEEQAQKEGKRLIIKTISIQKEDPDVQ